MASIERHRVIGKTDEELDELTCGICQQIFNDPVVTNCCRQTYCKGCINEWLKENQNCPNDRKKLVPYDLIPAPRVLNNLLNLLSIKCEFHTNQCQTVLSSVLMREHVQSCDKNPEKCNSCDLKTIEMTRLNNEIIRLRNQLTIPKYSAANLTSPQYLIRVSREHINDFRCIKIHKISDTLYVFIHQVCKDAIRQNNDFNGIAAQIIANLKAYEKKKLGSRPKWSTIVSIDGTSVLSDRNKKYVELRFHKINCLVIRDKELTNH